MIGIITENATVTLENCNFAAPGTTLGYDIMVNGETQHNIIKLKNTLGTTNQIKNIPTNKGNIIEVIR
ncbi:MAG: hypothetical protein ACRYE9_00145 [Janthinobacterium lividum]